MRSTCIHIFFLVFTFSAAVVHGSPVVRPTSKDGENWVDSTRAARQELLWTGFSDITAVLGQQGPKSAVAKPVINAVTQSQNEIVSVATKSGSNSLTNGQLPPAPSPNSGNSGVGNSPARIPNTKSSPPRQPTSQQGQTGSGQQGQGQKKGNNSPNKKNTNNKKKPAASKESSEETSGSNENDSSQESDEAPSDESRED